MTMTENPFILRGYDCVDFKETEDEIAVRLRLPAPMACEQCGTVGQLVKNGSRDMEITDLPVHDKPVSVWIDRQRFMCRACGCYVQLRAAVKDQNCPYGKWEQKGETHDTRSGNIL